VAAGWAECDTAPLNRYGEMLARVAGLPTYSLAWRGGRYELHYRESWHISASPPGDEAGVDVIVKHTCGVDIAHVLPSRLGGPIRSSPPRGDAPPF
jgi:hypothetical protein